MRPICGLVGYTGRHHDGNYEKLEMLLYLDQIRGYDSTGIAVASKDSVSLFKKKGSPQAVMPCSEWEKIKKQNETPVALIGHNRAATKGVINEANAHPFTHGSITLAHNGTLNDKALDGGQKFGTDSEGVCYSMDKIGVEDVWKDLNGAACLTWWDDKQQSMNIIRNDKRPIHLMYLEDDSGVWWASESWMLRWLERYTGVEQKKVWSPNPHYHFKITCDGEKVSEVTKKLTPFTWPVYQSGKKNSTTPTPLLPNKGKVGGLLSRLDSLIPRLGSGTTHKQDNTNKTQTGICSPADTNTFRTVVTNLSGHYEQCMLCTTEIKKTDVVMPVTNDLGVCPSCREYVRETNMAELSRSWYLKELAL